MWSQSKFIPGLGLGLTGCDPGGGSQLSHLSNGQHRLCQRFTPGYSVNWWVKYGKAHIK